MELVQVFHMNGGNGETSYAENSSITRKVISITKPIVEEAIMKYYSNSLSKTLAIADMGCSSGPNTLLAVSIIVKAVHNLCRRLSRQSPELQVHFNDLPGNDFNSIFVSIPSFQEELKSQMGLGFGPCFFTGVPGSFYGRLFPTESLDFVHSSYGLHWLSQVPDEIDNNKGNICVTNTSPPEVIMAYREQFEKDFSVFLMSRSEELVTGGQMVVTFCGRMNESLSNRDGCYMWVLLAMALNDMVSEGLIEEEQVDTFNIPMYSPCPSEVKTTVLKEGSFMINRLEVTQVNWDARDDDGRNEFETLNDSANRWARCLRSVTESLLVNHFGEGISEEVFRRYGKIITHQMSIEKYEYINVTICLTKN